MHKCIEYAFSSGGYSGLFASVSFSLSSGMVALIITMSVTVTPN